MSSGTRLGPYEIVAPIGAGGMGEVYSARDTRLGRLVAIKILPAEFAENAQLKIRFEREAKTISNLSHPHICALFDVGENYLVMELLEGETLADRLTKGALPISEALKYGAQIADALGKAHREGVVHRDLKPGNVMVTKSGAKLLDFGLAKTIVPATPEGATVQKPLTQEGLVVGTFQYMAPEQLAGEEPDARTDIFAFGALLYEMATGQRAFEGKSKTSLIAAIMSSEPKPISEMQPLTPPALEHVVKKCLAKDPDERWQSATDVAEELRWIRDAGSQAGVAVPVTVRRRIRERTAWVVAATALAAVAVTSGIQYWKSRSRTTAAFRFSIPATTPDYTDGDGYVSPDGKYLLMIGKGKDGVARYWKRAADSLTPTPIAGTEGAGNFPILTPDGKDLYFVNGQNTLMRMPMNGGHPETVARIDALNPRRMTVNGLRVILFDLNGSIMKISPGETTPRVLVAPNKAQGEEWLGWPRFLPDGNHYLLLAGTGRGGNFRKMICVGSLDSTQRRVLLAADSHALYAPPGYLLFVRDSILFAVPFNAKRGEVTGTETRIADNVESNVWGWAGFSVSRTGILAYREAQSNQRIQPAWFDLSGRQLGDSLAAGSFQDARISPDGRAFAICITDLNRRKGEIWLYEGGRGSRSRLAYDSEMQHAPLWLSGDRIVYEQHLADANKFAEVRIATAFSSGTKYETVTASGNGSFHLYQATPDEKIIYLKEGSRKIWEAGLRDGQPARVLVEAPYDVCCAQRSPDGKWLVYVASELGHPEIYLTPYGGPARIVQVSKDGASAQLPRWTPDGKSILFAKGADLMSVDVRFAGTELKLSEPKLRFKAPAPISGFDIARDGRLLALLAPPREQSATVVVVNWPIILENRSQ